MKRLFILLFGLIICVSCGILSCTETGSQKNVFERNFSNLQFDSICKADSISKDLHTWHHSEFIDAESNQHIHQYLFIKYNDSIDIVYRYQRISDDSINLTKRVTIK